MNACSKFRVLAVDDDRDILDLIKLTLERDYEVIAVQDSQDALDFLEFIEPDLVILDIMMPHITGYKLAETIRADPHLKHAAIVFLSAKNTSHDMKYGYKLGANFYLTKPFQPERIRRTVDMLLKQNPAAKPIPKQLSPRDVALRIQLKVVASYGHGNPMDGAPSHDLHGSKVRHSRTVDIETPEEEGEKPSATWCG